MKVLHVVPAAFGRSGNIGGAERYALELSRAMQAFTQVLLVAQGERREAVSVDRFDITVLPGRPLAGNDMNRIGTAIIAAARTADVIHCHQHHVLSGSALALFGRATGRPVVATDHGGGGFDLSWYVDTDRLYAAHLHVSEFSRARARETKVLRRVVYAGVDTDRFSPSSWDVPRRRALFVGRVLPHKRVDVLIRALPEGMGLDVVGPSHDPRYSQDLERLAVGKPVSFLGPIEDLQLAEMYRRAICVVLPSACDDPYGGYTEVPELLGQTLLEGMASGIPAVCSDVGGMPEIVRDQVTGLIVVPGRVSSLHDALVTLLDDQAGASAMGARGRVHVREHFSWPKVAARCVETYEALLATRARTCLSRPRSTYPA